MVIDVKIGSLLATLALAATGFLAAPLPRSLAEPSVHQWGNWLQIDAPNPAHARPVTLWATYYAIHRAQMVARGQPLIDPVGRSLGPTLSNRDWCYAALEGTVLIDDGRSRPTTYNFAGRGDNPQVDCSPFFSSLSSETLDRVSRVRFSVATAPYGYGTGGFNLVPYRTIAVDRTQIPIGSVLFIPAARGMRITLPTGEQAIHDGYFYAADVGSAIHGNHIDVFLGATKHNPFPFIASRSSGTFKAYLVEDSEISRALWTFHRMR